MPSSPDVVSGNDGRESQTDKQPLLDKLKYLLPEYVPKEQKSLWSASRLGKCQRIQLLAAKGLSLPLDSATQRKYSMATGAHNKVQDWVRQNFTPTSTEYYVNDDDLRCSGHIDCIIYVDDTEYLIEVKTTQFHKTTDRPYWQRQISFYTDTLKKLHEGNTVVPIMLMAQWDGRLFPAQPNVSDEYIDVINQLNMYWDMDMVPPWQSEPGCKDCRIKHLCTEPCQTLTEFHDLVQREVFSG